MSLFAVGCVCLSVCLFNRLYNAVCVFFVCLIVFIIVFFSFGHVFVCLGPCGDLQTCRAFCEECVVLLAGRVPFYVVINMLVYVCFIAVVFTFPVSVQYLYFFYRLFL